MSTAQVWMQSTFVGSEVAKLMPGLGLGPWERRQCGSGDR